jgi:murein DD-endopeptidase MepM/ murein hydrolase activator NlpD
MKKLFILLFCVLATVAIAQDIKLVWPLKVAGTPKFTDLYGLTANPMGGGGPGRFHYGIDLPCVVGTPVIAIADATVIVCAKGDASLGNFMILHLANGWDFTYGHLKETWFPRGTVVKQGQVIGLSGNSGYSSGPHLHFQWSQDPMVLFKAMIPAKAPSKWSLVK